MPYRRPIRGKPVAAAPSTLPAPSETIIAPQAGPQYEAARCSADILIFGGAAGGGKTISILIEPLRHVANPRFTCVIFRRTLPEITKVGALWDESQNFYPLCGGHSRENYHDWIFPSGARIQFGTCQYNKDLEDWKGAQINLLEFDQLETFSEKQFWYFFSRNRSVSGIRSYIRATCNPMPETWLARFLEWYIDQDTGYVFRERSGVVRYFVRISEKVYWGDSREALQSQFPDHRDDIKSFCFIRSDVYDNKILLARDPSYLANLNSLTPVEQERLLRGNWKVREEAGKIFNRAWFEIVEAAPVGGQECRRFDFAATKKQALKADPDFTASVKMRKVNGVYYVLDVTAEQLDAAEVDTHFLNLTQQDYNLAKLLDVRYRATWEVEPGSAGKREAVRLMRLLKGIDGKGVSSQGDKLTRAAPLASQARASNVKLVKGAWNETFLAHMHGQPEWPHDDIMDAGSGAFQDLNDDFSNIYDFYKRKAAEKDSQEAGRVEEEKTLAE